MAVKRYEHLPLTFQEPYIIILYFDGVVNKSSLWGHIKLFYRKDNIFL